MSADPDNKYVFEGLADTLPQPLAPLPDPHVAARTPSFAFKSKYLAIGEIGEALNVAQFPEAGVQWDAHRVPGRPGQALGSLPSLALDADPGANTMNFDGRPWTGSSSSKLKVPGRCALRPGFMAPNEREVRNSC
ncbi:MAG: hypothetical protein P8Y40_09935 [Desulfobacterales bacterium]